MKKILFYVCYPNSFEFYSGYTYGFRSKSGRLHPHLKRRLHKVSFDTSNSTYSLLPTSFKHSLSYGFSA